MRHVGPSGIMESAWARSEDSEDRSRTSACGSQMGQQVRATDDDSKRRLTVGTVRRRTNEMGAVP